MALTMCEDCKNTKVKSRVNYSHGKNSKSITTLICKACGSHNIKVTKDLKRRKR